MNEISIKTLKDILDLNPEQFERFLPDLRAWYELSKPMMQTGFIVDSGMRWYDDGKIGQIHSVDLLTTDGEFIETIRGPAHPEGESS